MRLDEFIKALLDEADGDLSLEVNTTIGNRMCPICLSSSKEVCDECTWHCEAYEYPEINADHGEGIMWIDYNAQGVNNEPREEAQPATKDEEVGKLENLLRELGKLIEPITPSKEPNPSCRGGFIEPVIMPGYHDFGEPVAFFGLGHKGAFDDIPRDTKQKLKRRIFEFIDSL